MIIAHHSRSVRYQWRVERWLALGIAALGVVIQDGGAAQALRAEPAEPPLSVAVYALSRGKGVPESTRKALRDVFTLFEGLQRSAHITRIEQSRIGLEGETRVCVEFKNAEVAKATIGQLRSLGRDVELFNVVEEPCWAK